MVCAEKAGQHRDAPRSPKAHTSLKKSSREAPAGFGQRDGAQGIHPELEGP